MWLVYRKDLRRDGSNPALLYAYGSYGSSMSAGFSSNVFSLVDRGVVYAIAYIRGGGELGKKWHDEGRMLAKKNTFTDFIAAAEHLVDGKYTSRDRLAIMGGSAGGLLMGAVTNMRPDLFKVVVSYVPFVDVINTMLDESVPLTVGEFEEWGNPKKEAEYRYMKSYSPYDNLAARAYPTMLVKSSYNDSQVMYWEPAKYVAKLRALKTDANPLALPHQHGSRRPRRQERPLRPAARDRLRLRVPALAARRGEGGTVKAPSVRATLVLALAVGVFAPRPTAAADPPAAANLEARRAFQDARFGLFVHWGVYSILGDGEWVMHNAPHRRPRLREAARPVQPDRVRRRGVGRPGQGGRHEVHHHHQQAPRRLRDVRLEGAPTTTSWTGRPTRRTS